MSEEIAAAVKTIFLLLLVRASSLHIVSDISIILFSAPGMLPELSSLHQILLLLPRQGAGTGGEVCQGLGPAAD